MANGVVLNEIKDLLRDDKPLDSGVALRLMLAAMSDLLQKMDEDKSLIEVNKNRIEKMYPVYNWVIWLSGLLGVSVFALVWGLITGTATIVIR